jgi:hypothetical protein
MEPLYAISGVRGSVFSVKGLYIIKSTELDHFWSVQSFNPV